MEMKEDATRDLGAGQTGQPGRVGGPGSCMRAGRDPLADVLPGEDDAAGLAFETADVPLLVQCQERLAVLDLLLASSTVCKHKRTLLSKASGPLGHGRHLSPGQGHLSVNKVSHNSSHPGTCPELHWGRQKATRALASRQKCEGERKTSQVPPESSRLSS